jgi:hypothetical protein
MSDSLRQRNVNFGVSALQAQAGDHLITDALTLKYSQIPEWQKDNEFILSGYRR